MVLSVVYGMDTSTCTSTSTKGYVILLNNHLNTTDAMVSLVAPSVSHYCHVHVVFHFNCLDLRNIILPFRMQFHLIRDRRKTMGLPEQLIHLYFHFAVAELNWITY